MDRLVSPELLSRLNTLGDFLRVNIIGQDEVITEIVDVLQPAFCRLRFPSRPVASMLFLGATGVAKTETALLFTEHLFGSPEKLLRLDMSEYMTLDSIDILRGSNVHERGVLGLLYDRSGGSGTILFDELEKAHRLIGDVLLQILSAARFTLATGETLDLSNYVVVATTNIGSRMLMESRSTDRETLVRRTMQAGTDEMRPETLGRFELKGVFNKLGYEQLREIAKIQVAKALALINAGGHQITIGSGVVEYVQRMGYSLEFGARPMQFAAMQSLRAVVSREMLKTGGRAVCGSVEYDRRGNKCFLVQ